jgi:hypothetical protein
LNTNKLTHSLPAKVVERVARDLQIVEATAGDPLRNVKPFSREVWAEIDNELMAKSIDFMKRATAARKPFFLYLPFSMGHTPNLLSKQFAGKSRIRKRIPFWLVPVENVFRRPEKRSSRVVPQERVAQGFNDRLPNSWPAFQVG